MMNTNMQVTIKRWMKRVSMISVMAASTTVALHAQKLAKDVFVNMPDSTSLLLTSVNRADCIDFIESNMAAKVENRFGRTSEMTALTDDYISMQMSSKSTWQMKLLSLNDSLQVISTISTVCAPACDSDIRFYDLAWNELPKEQFLSVVPSASIFLKDYTNQPDSLAMLEKALVPADVFLYKASYVKDQPTLTLEWTTPLYMEKEAAKALEPFIAQPVTLKWANGKLAY